MIVLAVFCALGLPAGFLLLWRVPRCRPQSTPQLAALSIIVPARNEERNLPILLQSIRSSSIQPSEVIVVDDSSTDKTASVARDFRAQVVTSKPLPPGWTGKTWACSQGAEAATSDLFLFLDADTSFDSRGLENIVSAFAGSHDTIALSILPWHVTRQPYEELSLFFNLLMAIGAGGFGLIGSGRLFGQSLLVSRATYTQIGGHGAVRKSILENFALASHVASSGARCVCFGGRGTINVRMFPDGFAQLCEGWTKAFADGAAASDPLILGISIFWLTALCATPLSLAMSAGPWRIVFTAFYVCFVLQLLSFARQIGTYRVLTCLLYPLPLLFYFGVFGQSLYRRVFKRQVSWRGRQL